MAAGSAPLPTVLANAATRDAAGSRLLDDAEEGRLFRRLRGQLMRSSLRQLMATARLRLWLTSLLSFAFWLGLFYMSYEGFMFLHGQTGRAEEIVFNLFYGSLTPMLTFSCGIILYAGLYDSQEVGFLLATPARPERIFIHRFHEAAMLSSWGFLLLGSPVLAAYGLVVDAPWYFYVLLFPYMVAFAMIPSGIGAIACLLIVRLLARFRRIALGALCLVTLMALVIVLWSVIAGGDGNLLSNRWFDQMLSRVNNVPSRLFPHWWLSAGLIEGARSEWKRSDYQPWAQSLLFLSLLTANALVIHQIAVAIAGRVLRESYHRLHTLGTPTRQAGEATVDRLMDLVLRPLPTPTRLLLLKDFRIFRRDPTQWTQFLIFLGLVLLFFMATPWLAYGPQFAVWINVVSFLNLSVVGLILSTFTTRFIFPMISLEGRRFWVLGPLPISRDTILWGKFLFAALGAVLPCAILILLSDVMLRINPVVILVHQVCGVLMCVGLAAVAVGLGARMPDLRESNPSKIAAGFGGTLNLVLSAMFVLAVVALTAVPSYYYVEALQKPSPDPVRLAQTRLLIAAACGGAVLLGVAVTAITMVMGLRSFRRLEY